MKVYVAMVLTESDRPGDVDAVFTNRDIAEQYVALRTKEAQAAARADGPRGVADAWWLDEGELDPESARSAVLSAVDLAAKNDR